MLIIHIITGLHSGGAESSLYNLVTSDKQNVHRVVSLGEDGFYGPKLRKKGVSVTALGFKGNYAAPLCLYPLIKILLKETPDVVQTWLYHADLLGGLAAKICRVPRIVWNIRMTDPWSKTYGRSLKVVVILCKYLSWHIPHRIVVCAHSAARNHSARGYNAKIMSVITNGYDLNKYRFDRLSDEQTKSQYVVGVVGRWDPVKNFSLLLRAFADARISRLGNFKLVMIGGMLTKDNKELVDLISTNKIEGSVELLGIQEQMPMWYNVMDVLVNCSFDEGFPNVVAEATCSGLRSIATDVGDSAYILGDTGWVIKVDDVNDLVNALLESYKESQDNEKLREHEKLCLDQARRVLAIGRMIIDYQTVWSNPDLSIAD